MTGFGRATAEHGRYSISAELRSVNSRNGLELRMKLPLSYREREFELRKLLGDKLVQGKVDFNFAVTYAEGVADYTIDRNAFKAYAKELTELANETGLDKGDLLYTVSRMPNVLVPRETLVDEQEWKDAQAVIMQAIEGFRKFRAQEGVALERDLRERVTSIQSLLLEIDPFDAARLERVRERLRQHLEDGAFANGKVDDNRFEQEIIYYIERLDVNEEKVRLRQHCEYFLSELDGDKSESRGKKLGFISQEMGREINTLGSKASDAPMQRLVVAMKDELERIKEQVLNVL